MEEVGESRIAEAGNEARQMMREVVDKLAEAQKSNDKFFPNGIEKIDVEISVGPPNNSLFQAKLLIEGPQPRPGVEEVLMFDPDLE